MEGGVLTSRTFDNLMAFWPGMQTLMGEEGFEGEGREGKDKGRTCYSSRRDIAVLAEGECNDIPYGET